MPTFTRSQLYDLVWTEPRSKLAKQLGVSDVWIRKTCVRASIPVPGRGHWARLEAGKKITRIPLPPRELGQADSVTLGPEIDRWGYRRDRQIVVPPEPNFEESIEAVRARAAKLIGAVPPPRGLTKTSAPIEALLADEEARRQAQLKDPYAWKKPRFTKPAALRRLKLLNALTLALERAGFPSTVNADDLHVSVSVYDSGAGLDLHAISNRTLKHHTNPLGLADDKNERLQMEFTKNGLVVESLGPWQDTPEEPLELQLTAIATEVLVRAEMSHRASVLYRRNWAIKELQARDAAALKEQQAKETAERERLAREAKAKVDHLLGLAKALEQAEKIRSLVLAVGNSHAAHPEFQRWCAWASATADSIDPRLMAFERLFTRTEDGEEDDHATTAT